VKKLQKNQACLLTRILGVPNIQSRAAHRSAQQQEEVMITKTRQNWTAGQTVKVGFLSLIVKAAVATPGDYLPDAYILANQAGTQLYRFVPHNGLEKITVAEAKEMMAEAEARASRIAAAAIERAAATREIDAIFA